jgi:hypothetical protein
MLSYFRFSPRFGILKKIWHFGKIHMKVVACKCLWTWVSVSKEMTVNSSKLNSRLWPTSVMMRAIFKSHFSDLTLSQCDWIQNPFAVTVCEKISCLSVKFQESLMQPASDTFCKIKFEILPLSDILFTSYPKRVCATLKTKLWHATLRHNTECSRSLFTEKPDIKTIYLLSFVLQKWSSRLHWLDTCASPSPTPVLTETCFNTFKQF